ncbi:MAG TPA: hypothetical protein VFK30_13155 [Anaerolineae bacterium]|nr:hypothetical protein [Anaerolineae bacterium]
MPIASISFNAAMPAHHHLPLITSMIKRHRSIFIGHGKLANVPLFDHGSICPAPIGLTTNTSPK